jgi:hypothetical protein
MTSAHGINRLLSLLVACAIVALLVACAAGCGGSEPIVARVSAMTVSKTELEHWMTVERAVRADARAEGGTRRHALEFLITARWLLGEARELGVSVSDREVGEQLHLFKLYAPQGVQPERFAEEARFRKYLMSERIGVRDQEWVMKLALLATRLQRAHLVRAEHGVTDAKIEAYYRGHVQRLYRPMRSYFEILMTRTEPEALKARREVEAGQDFLRVAQRVSIDPEAPHGLQALSPGEEEPLFRAAIFGARPHVLVGPVHQANDYYVFKVLRVRPRTILTLAQAGPRIRALLARRLAATGLVRAYERKWVARTRCERGYATGVCRHGATRATAEG